MGFSTGFPVESVEKYAIFSQFRVKLLKKRWKKLKMAWLRRLKSALIVENSVEIWESFRGAGLGVLTVFVKNQGLLAWQKFRFKTDIIPTPMH